MVSTPDIPEVSHVFNFSPPPKQDDYVHRIGRTGRAGRKGESYTIVGPEDAKSWDQILKMIGKDVEAFTPEGLAEELKDLPADSGGRSRNRRGSKPSGGGKNSSAGEKSSSGKSEPSSRAEKDEKPQRERKGRSRGRKNDDELEPATADKVVGMGEHVPDFLKR